jgi:hypothetical protein
MKPIYDKLGREIKPGDYIVYGHLLGRCAGLKVGKVVVIKPVPKDQFGESRITVMGVDDGWGDRKPRLDSKKGTLQFPDRILVVEKSSLPKKYLDLLDRE